MPEYPEYDRALECLAWLPKYPCGLSLTVLAAELKMSGQSAVRAELDELERRGILVRVWTADNHRVAGVTAADWDKAQRIASEYVDAREAAIEATIAAV